MLLLRGFEFKIDVYLKFTRVRMFNKYVTHFYHLRRYTGLSVMRNFYKLCLNSLYGKFSTKISRSNSLQISMAVNSYSRVEMAQYRGSYFIYTDTDSIVYPIPLISDLIGPEIGMMKRVAKIDWGLFIPNYYMYSSGKRTVIKAKGMIKRVAPKLSGLFYDFKLSYFKKQNYKIVVTETVFRYRYYLNNTKFYEKKNFLPGVC